MAWAIQQDTPPRGRVLVVDDDPGLLKLLSIRLRAEGYEVGGEQYKRVPRGYEADQARADLLRYKGLYARSPKIEAAILTTPALLDVCFEHCNQMAPLHRWLVQTCQRAKE